MLAILGLIQSGIWLHGRSVAAMPPWPVPRPRPWRVMVAGPGSGWPGRSPSRRGCVRSASPSAVVPPRSACRSADGWTPSSGRAGARSRRRP
ncbi:hypothetical protein [Luteococcus sp. H101]